MSRSRIGVRPTFMFVCLTALALALACTGCGKGDDEEQTPAQGQDQHAQQQGQNQHAQQQPQQGQQQGQRQRPGGQPGQRPGGASGQPAVPVAIQAATSGPISSYYRATATLEAEKSAQVLARATGVVGALHAEEGDVIAEGGLLLTIENAEYRYRLDQAAAATANLRARYERLEQMRAEDIATEEEFEAARSDLASAEADEGMARLNLSYTGVKAPFGGAVTERLVDLGQNVSVGDPLFVMADFEPLLARVHVPSREFKKLQQDQSVDLVLDSDGSRLSGRIKLISPVIDPNSGTIKITVEVPDYPAGTRPGDFAQVQIVTERREGAVLVPRGAVLTDKGETVVYTLTRGRPGQNGETGPSAERRLVTVGFTDDEHAQILEGLEAGERVVTKGQRSLKHGMAVKVLEGMGPGRGQGRESHQAASD